jgi:drug/metabolite transporter (DMT)-like permease
MIVFWKNVDRLDSWLAIVALGIFSYFFQYLLTRALKSARTTKVVSIAYLSVPFGGLLGWWFFNETPSLWTMIGTLLIIIGGIISVLSQKPARPKKTF